MRVSEGLCGDAGVHPTNATTRPLLTHGRGKHLQVLLTVQAKAWAPGTAYGVTLS